MENEKKKKKEQSFYEIKVINTVLGRRGLFLFVN